MSESLDDLMAGLSLIDRQLGASDESTADLIDALVDTARGLKVPVAARSDETHRFLEGAEPVARASWLQCGGLIFALAEGQVVDQRAVAAQLARRIFDLAPTHY